MEMNAEIKAQLLHIGSANIHKGLLEELTSTTASPCPGVRLESTFLKLVKTCHGVVVVKDGEPLVAGQIESALAHYPEQAYITISDRYIFDCKFCPVPGPKAIGRSPAEAGHDGETGLG